ncbi:tRNA (adenosine(37)-N6)-threonylcarbamoyltransferase complex dimerization subunit type 1 TsaB [Urbifossiella limnaea]|uniref:tRNA threonylcarbamoyladenosine biosynthesis protein TsaB n=1 Tax=Urbifossiella limnaea TaxID=2528023 RepID=A0A517XMW8_9BACT|nr:tRNA (adenosine(37)-N6)-threonylcarbamoyltransferase complex dimerization subunit type 1 TsaB [Urbifossiella limnaea]QDU18850.1 tRNA threonylcarbamoyladenosine biosynthesis protein TsaB [Urbifossiella limnaea]
MGEHWLVIDTASRTGRLGLVRDGTVVGAAALDAARRHARDLTPAAAALLDAAGVKPAGLTGVVVSVGPGSFTGLRVGIMAAKALSYATGCALVAVPTFAAIANRAPAEAANLWVIADALQGQAYLQRYRGGEAVEPLRIVTAAEVLPAAPADVWFSGPGVATFEPLLADRSAAAEREPSVESLYAASRGIAPLTRAEMFELEPLYLRGSSAEEAAKKQAHEGGSP